MAVTGGTVRGGSGEPTFTANGSGSTSKNVAYSDFRSMPQNYPSTFL